MKPQGIQIVLVQQERQLTPEQLKAFEPESLKESFAIVEAANFMLGIEIHENKLR